MQDFSPTKRHFFHSLAKNLAAHMRPSQTTLKIAGQTIIHHPQTLYNKGVFLIPETLEHLAKPLKKYGQIIIFSGKNPPETRDVRTTLNLPANLPFIGLLQSPPPPQALSAFSKLIFLTATQNLEENLAWTQKIQKKGKKTTCNILLIIEIAEKSQKIDGLKILNQLPPTSDIFITPTETLSEPFSGALGTRILSFINA